MPPKKPTGSADADDDSFDERAQDSRLTILRAKREAIFEIVQNVYDLSSGIHSNPVARERFLAESSQIDSLRDKFEQNLDDYNSRLLSVNPLDNPDYKSLVAFESLYGRINQLRSQYSQSRSSQESRDISAPRKARPTLPPIQLMDFSGDIRSWPLFYASFKSTVHDNPSLSDAEKLYYLLGKLSGKASNVCAGIAPCAENYNMLLQALIDKYEDKRMLASAYLNQMFEFKPMQAASVTNFDLFTDSFISAVRALKNLKLDNLTDLIILHIALKKTDLDTVRAFELSCSSLRNLQNR